MSVFGLFSRVSPVFSIQFQREETRLLSNSFWATKPIQTQGIRWKKWCFFFFSPTRFPALFYICVRYFQDQEAPLHLAVKNNHIPVIHCLLTAGCDINATDKVPAAQHSSETVGQTLYILSVCVCVSPVPCCCRSEVPDCSAHRRRTGQDRCRRDAP